MEESEITSRKMVDNDNYPDLHTKNTQEVDCSIISRVLTSDLESSCPASGMFDDIIIGEPDRPHANGVSPSVSARRDDDNASTDDSSIMSAYREGDQTSIFHAGAASAAATAAAADENIADTSQKQDVVDSVDVNYDDDDEATPSISTDLQRSSVSNAAHDMAASTSSRPDESGAVAVPSTRPGYLHVFSVPTSPCSPTHGRLLDDSQGEALVFRIPLRQLSRDEEDDALSREELAALAGEAAADKEAEASRVADNAPPDKHLIRSDDEDFVAVLESAVANFQSHILSPLENGYSSAIITSTTESDDVFARDSFDDDAMTHDDDVICSMTSDLGSSEHGSEYGSQNLAEAAEENAKLRGVRRSDSPYILIQKGGYCFVSDFGFILTFGALNV